VTAKAGNNQKLGSQITSHGGKGDRGSISVRTAPRYAKGGNLIKESDKWRQVVKKMKHGGGKKQHDCDLDSQIAEFLSTIPCPKERIRKKKSHMGRRGQPESTLDRKKRTREGFVP